MIFKTCSCDSSHCLIVLLNILNETANFPQDFTHFLAIPSDITPQFLQVPEALVRPHGRHGGRGAAAELRTGQATPRAGRLGGADAGRGLREMAGGAGRAGGAGGEAIL